MARTLGDIKKPGQRHAIHNFINPSHSLKSRWAADCECFWDRRHFQLRSKTLGHGSTCYDGRSSPSKFHCLSRALSKLNLVELRPKEAYPTLPSKSCFTAHRIKQSSSETCAPAPRRPRPPWCAALLISATRGTARARCSLTSMAAAAAALGRIS
jgi:hypothetical protein